MGTDLTHRVAEGTTRWAAELLVAGLEPDEHEISFAADERPILRIHFAFAPALSDEAREALVRGIGAVAAREMQLALNDQ
ncbi:hypothetical protein [Streptomyces sp. NPDC059063]|uniref:hypothetical protein n=1 Tax=unclassified Streptomyces TaxID=2593676 RepID=UPI003697E049